MRAELSEKPAILVLDKPHFQVRLDQSTLKVDLKEGVRHEIEKLAEARPALRDTLGWVFQTIVPWNVRLDEIERVDCEASGRVNIKIPHHRDIHIPLDPVESVRLVDKLNELIPIEKERSLLRHRMGQEAHQEDEQATVEDYKYVRRGP